MVQILDLLDPLSEMIALSTYGNTKNLIITAVELRGPIKRDAVTAAVHRAVAHFPRLKCTIKELKTSLRRRLAWEPRSGLEFPVHIWTLAAQDASTTRLTAFLDQITPHLERDWDLFNELPGEFHLMKIAPDYYMAGPVLHHAASDAVGAIEFGRRIFLEYHEIVTGEKHEALGDALVLSTSKKRMVRPRKRSWDNVLVSARQALIPFTPRLARPAGTGFREDLGQHHVKRVLSEEESQRVTDASRRKGISVIDFLAACANIAVDKWNEARNVPRGTLTNSMTVNMKGRYSELDNPNAGGILFFKSCPVERTDTTAFAKALAVDRIKQFRKQMDFSYYGNVSRFVNSFRVLPFGPRRRLFHSILHKHRVSVGLTFMGVVWPRIQNGKPTAESGLTKAGGLEVTEVHGTGYKLLSSTPLLIIVYQFRDRINFVLAVSASLFTREESEAYLDLVIRLLLDS